MAKKYVLSIFIMVFIVSLITAAMMLAIIRQEVSNQYKTLQTIADRESHLLHHIASFDYSNKENPLQCLFGSITKNKQTYTFALTGDTIIAKNTENNFRFLYSAKRGDLSSSVNSSLDNAFENSFARALLFGDTTALIGVGFDNKIIVSAAIPIKLFDNELELITSIDLEEILQPYSDIILTTLLAEFILLSIGTIFIVFIYTKSLRRAIRETSKELALSKEQIRELQNIEKSLAEIRKDMEEALEVGLFGFWLYNLSTGKSIRSLMHEHIFGYDAVVEKWNFDILLNHIVNEDKSLVKASFEKAVSDNSEIDIACRILKRNNEQRWIWLRGKKRSDGCLIGIIRDITSRKTLEKELADFREHLEELVKIRTSELEEEKEKLQQALSSIKTLKSLLPICSGCGKIREDDGYWSKVETYIQKHTDSKFSHALCSECLTKLYPDLDIK